jgi:hypothetical protein
MFSWLDNEKQKKEDCFSIRACDLVVRKENRSFESIKTLPSFISFFSKQSE